MECDDVVTTADKDSQPQRTVLTYRTSLMDGQITVFDRHKKSEEARDVCPEIATFLDEWTMAILDAGTSQRLFQPLLQLVANTRVRDGAHVLARDDKEVLRRRRLMAIAWNLRTRIPTLLRLVPALERYANAFVWTPHTVDSGYLVGMLPVAQDTEEAAFEAMLAASYTPSGVLARRVALLAEAESGGTAVRALARTEGGVADSVTKFVNRAARCAMICHMHDGHYSHTLRLLAEAVAGCQNSSIDLVGRLCAVKSEVVK